MNHRNSAQSISIIYTQIQKSGIKIENAVVEFVEKKKKKSVLTITRLNYPFDTEKKKDCRMHQLGHLYLKYKNTHITVVVLP